MRISIHLRDLGDALVRAWRTEFAGVATVEVSQGDIFSSKSGVVSPGDPIDVRADAVVSPANSFGFMDGGIDAVYTYQLGPQLQQRVQAEIAAAHDTCNAYLAFRAALIAARIHNRSGRPPIRTILCPGLGTAVGRMPVARCAHQMRVAWDRVLGNAPFAPTTLRTAAQDEADLLR